MIITELSHLETVAEASSILGGATTIEHIYQWNQLYLSQDSDSTSSFSASSFSVDGDLTVKSKSYNYSKVYQSNSIST